MLGEQCVLVGSDMLKLKKDIGNHNAFALRRHYGVLLGWVQSNKLVVSRNEVTIRDLVLAVLVFPKHSDRGPFSHFWETLNRHEVTYL